MKGGCEFCGCQTGWHLAICPMRQPPAPVKRRLSAGDRWFVVALIVTTVLALALLATTLLTGCHAGELAAPCDTGTLTGIELQCRADVRRDCARSDAGVVDESCATLKACTKRIQEWRACSDAGAGGGS